MMGLDARRTVSDMPGQAPPLTDERKLLLTYIAQQRDGIRNAAYGRTDEQAAWRRRRARSASADSSSMSRTWRRVGSALDGARSDWVPFVFHFDFSDKATGQPVMAAERKRSIRDRYIVTVPDQRLDFRLAAAMTVALDALQSR